MNWRSPGRLALLVVLLLGIPALLAVVLLVLGPFTASP